MSEGAPPAWLRARPDGILLRIFVQPKAARSAWAGVHGEGDDARIKIRIAAPPVDGEANAETVRFVRKALKSTGVREVRLVRGEAARQKDLLLIGASVEAVRRALFEPPK